MSQCTECSNTGENGSGETNSVSKGDRYTSSGAIPSGTRDHGQSVQNRQIKSLQFSEPSKDPLTSQIDNLSPTTRGKVQVIIESLSNHSAVFVEDEKGRPSLQYNQKQKLYWDASNANKIAVPKSEQDIKAKTEVCLEMLEYLKLEKAPSGVVLNKLEIHTERGQYRENIEFEKTKEVLGRGNSAGDIVVIKDKVTGNEHAQKTIMISVFRPEEIRAWVDLSMEGVSPELYMFRLDGNKVVVHMEKLDNAVTLNDVINNHIDTLRQTNAALLKPFSLSVFHNLLEVVHTMHEKGWTHRDLHSGNVMIQKKSDCEVKVKVLDFGNAGRIDSKGGLSGIKSDVLNALRTFSALYLGEEFQSQLDLEQNWKQRLLERMQGLDDKEKGEMFCLFESALRVLSADDIVNLKQTVEDMAELDSVTEVMKEVVPILFPEEFAQNEESGSDEDSVDFAPPSIESIIQRLRRSIMIGQLFKQNPVIMIG